MNWNNALWLFRPFLLLFKTPIQVRHIQKSTSRTEIQISGCQRVISRLLNTFSDSTPMSKIYLDNILVSPPSSSIVAPIILDITFTATEALPSPVSWKLIYVGSAFSEDYDQTLEEAEIEKIGEASTLNFILECPAPNLKLIPHQELLCTTALILSGSYRGQEFVRVGYYVHNSVSEPDKDTMTVEDIISKGERTIIMQKPRITKFNIQWGDEESLTQQLQRQVDFEGEQDSNQAQGSSRGQNKKDLNRLQDKKAGDKEKEEEGNRGQKVKECQQARVRQGFSSEEVVLEGESKLNPTESYLLPTLSKPESSN